MELEALQEVYPAILEASASLVAISPQLARYSKSAVKKNGITFPVLCDRSNQVASRFNLVHTLPGDLRKVYTGFGIDLERFNGDDAWQLPMPARFIIDTGGRIIDGEAHPDYTKRPDPKAILDALKNR